MDRKTVISVGNSVGDVESGDERQQPAGNYLASTRLFRCHGHANGYSPLHLVTTCHQGGLSHALKLKPAP